MHQPETQPCKQKAVLINSLYMTYKALLKYLLIINKVITYNLLTL